MNNPAFERLKKDAGERELHILNAIDDSSGAKERIRREYDRYLSDPQIQRGYRVNPDTGIGV